RVAGLVAAVAQLAQVRHRCVLADEGMRAVAQHGLLFVQDKGHVGFLVGQAPGRPRMRLEMMLSWTSLVPPSIELALLRSQSRARAPSSLASPSHSSATAPPIAMSSSLRRLCSSEP